MNWNVITEENHIEEIREKSNDRPQIIFKHSTRCSISSVAKNRLEKANAPEEIPFHYLDLLSFRPLSNSIAEHFAVEHESPQILVIKDGKCVYDESHMGIDMEEIKDQLQLN